MAKRSANYRTGRRPAYRGPKPPDRPSPPTRSYRSPAATASQGYAVNATPMPYWALPMVTSGAFDEQNLNSNPARPAELWGHPGRRLNRYEVYWALYEQNVYRELHYWAAQLKDTFDLYPAIRSLESPAYRVGEFWAEHIFGGVLDPDAGDGISVPSCLPIRTRNDALRPVIAQVWRDGVFQVQKDVIARFGAVMGDVGVMVCDDTERESVYMHPLNPRYLRDKDENYRGDIRGYVVEERRYDPRYPYGDPARQLVTYSEIAERVGDQVAYTTYMDQIAFDWRMAEEGDSSPGAEWVESYGFIPLVVIQHKNKGMGWGWSEFQPTYPKMLEIDDMASKVNDQIRKAVNATWLMAGMANPNADIRFDYDDDGTLDPSGKGAAQARQQEDMIYAQDPQAHAQALVAPLDLVAVNARIQHMLGVLENDHPELLADMPAGVRDISSKTIRVAREKTEARVVAQRATYDRALVRALKMAIVIGAQKGYRGFEGIAARDIDDPELDFAIGERAVFNVDVLDRLEEAAARSTVVQTLVAAQWPVDCAMEAADYPRGLIDKVVAGKKKEQEEADARAMEMSKKFADIAPHASAASAQVSIAGQKGLKKAPDPKQAPVNQ